LSASDEASPAVKVIEEFAKMRGLSLDDAKVKNWQDMTAQPEQEHPLDKKADNARDLGLDYEPEQEPVKDWIASHNDICALLRQAHDALALTSYPPQRRWVCKNCGEQNVD
jgi:hypothetical protein